MTTTSNFKTSGRFQLVDSPALPGKCAVCGYSASGENEPSDRRQYIDFGMDLDFYGAVVICTVCMIEVAEGLGYILPERADEIITESERVKAENARLGAAVEVVNGLADVLIAGGWVTFRDDSNAVPGESILKIVDSPEGPDDSGPITPLNESRSNDLRNLDGLDL